MTKQPLVSIIIPAHNEQNRLPGSLAKIDAFLRTQSYVAEVIVVENGSVDNTTQVAQEFARTHPYVRLIEVSTRGKGLAVRAGMLAARGEYHFICDADLSMPIDELPKLLQQGLLGFDVVIGSREAKGATRIGEPLRRHLIGRVANAIIKVMALKGYEDTQCGFKLFSSKASKDLFTIQRINGIGFDVELVFLSEKRGYQICEVPIVWYYDGDSRMRFVEDSLRMIWEIYTVRSNWHKGIYAESHGIYHGLDSADQIAPMAEVVSQA